MKKNSNLNFKKGNRTQEHTKKGIKTTHKRQHSKFKKINHCQVYKNLETKMVCSCTQQRTRVTEKKDIQIESNKQQIKKTTKN